MPDSIVVFKGNQPEPPQLELSARQQEAVAALVAAPSITQAAKDAGVSRRSIYHWLEDPLFAEKLREARHQAMRRGIHHLHQICEQAAATLRSVMHDREASAAARVSASRAALALSFEGYEIDQIDAKIEEVDEARRALAESQRRWHEG